MSVVVYHIDAPGALRRRSGKIDQDVLVLNSHGYLDTNWPIKAVAPGFVLIASVGPCANGCAHGSLRTRDNFIGERINTIQAEIVHEVQQFARANSIGGGLSVQVADGLLGRAHIGADELEKLVIGFITQK